MSNMPSPNPSWQPGDKTFSPVNDQVTLDPSGLLVADIYRLLIGAIVPRPIALVSTVGLDGKGNLAPFSFFNGVSSRPACLMFSIARKADGSKKDTLLNIEETAQFVVNTASCWLAEPLVYCGAEFPRGTNEFEKSGFTPVPSIRVRPPRIKEAAIHFECELYKLLEIGEDNEPGSATLVVGRIVLMHIYKKAYHNGRIDFRQLEPLSRLGGLVYAEVGDTFELKVPSATGT
jgi:flavin reductase (DIM6/NTAB) family NADH-FMN oxidoreductase RutF